MRKTALTLLSATLAIAGIAAVSSPRQSGDAALARNLTTFNAIVKELQDN